VNFVQNKSHPTGWNDPVDRPWRLLGSEAERREGEGGRRGRRRTAVGKPLRKGGGRRRKGKKQGGEEA
jgi:hypothetical protein